MKEDMKKGRTEKKKMAVLTAQCDRMFRVDKDQIQLFKEVEKNPRNREKAEEAVSKIATKITTESKPISNDNS